MTWSQLVDRVVLQFGTNPHNKALARKFLEEAERDLAFHTKCLVRDKSIVVNEEDNYFELPNDFLELKSAVLYDEKTLEPYRNQIPRIKFDGTNVKGTPQYYTLTSNQIILVPHPESAGLVNFQYIAQPVNTEKGEEYVKINYKNLDNGFFQVGDKIKGATSQATGIVHRDVNDLKTGTLILKDYTPYVAESTTTHLQQNETIHVLDDAYQLAQVSGSYTFAQLESSWDTFGLSARATTSSVRVDWNDDDVNKPEIPDIYHLYLVDYAKSTIAENEKEFELADRYMARYQQNRELVRSQISGKGTGSGTMTVADMSVRDAYL
jgi:hypothetical protein